MSALASFTLYDISLFVHITAAVVGFGAAFAQSLTFPLAMRVGVQHLPYVHRLHLAINQRLVSPALLVVLLTGIYQVIDGDWGFDAPWVSASFLIVVVIGGLTGGYLVPAERRLEAEVEEELGAGAASLSPEYQRRARRVGGVSALTGLLVVVAIFLMVTKPGA